MTPARAAAPPLVHIGWPKTATTWLQEGVFREEHGFVQPVAREEIIRALVLPDQIDFDATAVESEWQPRLAAARERGLVPVVSHERLAGVLTHRLESVAFGERVVAVFEGARVLVIVREQRGALLAAWQQYVRNGGAPDSGPSVRSLTDFLGDDRARASALPPKGDLRYFEYDRLTSWYRERLGPERVLVLPFELLRKDAGSFLAQVTAFAGTVASEQPDLSPSNPAWAPLTYAVKRRLNYVGDRRRFQPGRRTAYQLGMSASYKLDSALPDFARSWGTQRQRATVAQLVGDHFLESNRRLQGLVDWDLAACGYLV